ncbi:MAG: diguanylate cyclase [Thermodesulfobacteriota bacterium]
MDKDLYDPTNPGTIFIVDDDDLVRSTLAALVKGMGYACETAVNGVEAVEVLRNKTFDLVLSDVVMPEMDGLELLGHVRKNYPETDVIIATGYSEKATYAEVIKAGAIDFIKKPIEVAELEAKLARAMRERSLMRKLEQLSLSDSLTGLLNRRAFEERFSREVDRATRQKYSLFLAIIDIDNFKSYNDSHGHQAGDKVLISLAAIFNDCTRKSVDLSFRLGGDEFAILLPQTTSDQAMEIVERVRSSFTEARFGMTSLSIGLVSCNRDSTIPQDRDEENMKEKADQAMYDAKSQGKNCVICRV